MNPSVNDDTDLSRVLLATDGSADATLAATAAIDLCGRTSVALDIVNAWGIPSWPAE